MMINVLDGQYKKENIELVYNFITPILSLVKVEN